jgi:hypothetical protein
MIHTAKGGKLISPKGAEEKRRSVTMIHTAKGANINITQRCGGKKTE